jgi:hypothetical protein
MGFLPTHAYLGACRRGYCGSTDLYYILRLNKSYCLPVKREYRKVVVRGLKLLEESSIRKTAKPLSVVIKQTVIATTQPHSYKRLPTEHLLDAFVVVFSSVGSSDLGIVMLRRS